MYAKVERRKPLSKALGADNAPNSLCPCTGQLLGVNVWISAECGGRVLLEKRKSVFSKTFPKINKG